MEKDLQIKYSKALQAVQRERNALRAENEQLKQQLAENEEYIKYNVPKLIEANKMMSHQLAEKEQRVAELEKALELACESIVETGKNKCKVCSMSQDACAGYKPLCSKYIKSHFIKNLKEGK